jgi:uncharacterized protein YdeI (YjbR/CyaY-like superfamily)
METDKALLFSNSLEWRQWLQRNHDKEKEVWLVQYKKNSGKSSLGHGDAVEEALCFGWIDSILKLFPNPR